jgi:hypothetical protein
MTSSTRADFVVALICFASIASYAQVASTETPACNPKLAQMLVEQQVAESKSVTARPKRIKILLRSADFLWTLDPPTSRSYFAEAFANAKEHFAEKGFEKANEVKSKTGRASAYVPLPDLRADVIRSTAKRDPELAKKFIDEVLKEAEKATERNATDKGREQGDLMGLATELSATDKEFSRFLFRRMMRYPLSQDWVWALNGTARNGQAFADSIYDEALRNYRNEPPIRMLYLSAYPFGATSIFGLGGDSFSLAAIPGFTPNVGFQRAFLDALFARIAAVADDPAELNQASETFSAVYVVTAMRDIEPIVVQRFPDMLQRFGVARAHANAAMTTEMRKDIENHEKMMGQWSTTFEESIKELEEADGKGTLTDNAVARLLFHQKIRTEKQFAAYEPWLAKIKEDKVRADSTGYFWFTRAKLAIKDRRFTDAEKMAAKVPELDHRAILLFEIAKLHLDSVNDAPTGFDMLNGISKLTRTAPNSVAKAQILLNLAQFYERVNHSVALDELAEAIRVVNRLDDPNLFETWVYRQIVGKDFAFMTSISLPGNNLEGMFTELGKKDFEMSLANARGFDDKYLRTIAIIATAQNCVSPPQKKQK